MATAEQLKALLQSFSNRDDARFRAVATQIAAQAAKQGKQKLADDLLALLEEASKNRALHLGPARTVAIARPPRELADLLVASYPETRLSEMVLADSIKSELARVITEYRNRDKLRSRDLAPRLRLLLVGPPGCGKTMTASALAGECHLPLIAVQLHALMTKFMGETAAKLHSIFESMQRTNGVYLFDEFDAIGSIRLAQNDVGEVRRVLNSFLQFIERHRSDSLIVAASNLVQLLDPALFRRFDVVLEYQMPADSMVRPLIENRLPLFNTDHLSWHEISRAAIGLSHADIVRAAEDAAKEMVLDDLPELRSDDLLRALHALKVRRPELQNG
jgi:SpoVK/Ycf46/Vps4 family AAA+-type ATPase